MVGEVNGGSVDDFDFLLGWIKTLLAETGNIGGDRFQDIMVNSVLDIHIRSMWNIQVEIAIKLLDKVEEEDTLGSINIH